MTNPDPSATPAPSNAPRNDGNSEAKSSIQRRRLSRWKLTAYVFVKVVSQSSPIILIVLLLMVVYYAPSLIISPSSKDFDLVLLVLYTKIRMMLMILSLSLLYISGGIKLFGHFFMIRPIVYVILPNFVFLGLVWPVAQYIGSFQYPITLPLSVITPIAMLYLIKKAELPPNADERLVEFHHLTKDGSPMAICKGILGFFFVLILFRFIFCIYLNANLYSQMVIRLLIAPLIVAGLQFFQTRILFGLSIEQMHNRLIASICSSQAMRFMTRLMVSVVVSAHYPNLFVWMIFWSTFVDSVLRITYLRRSRFFYHMMQKLKRLLRCLSCSFERKVANTNLVSVMNLESNPPEQSESVDVENQRALENQYQSNDQANPYSEYDPNYMIRMRIMHVIEEMGTELRVMVIVPILLFFLHNLYPDSAFQTIDSYRKVFYQICVQLFFVVIGDMVSLWIEMFYLDIPIEPDAIPWVDPFLYSKVFATFASIMYFDWYVGGMPP